jgi:ribonuclease Z
VRGYAARVDMDLIFLGTGGSVPTARRSTACLLARIGGDRLLFDCGEGSQRQMQRSTGLVQVDEIFVTHLHADHYLGIPGLLKTWDLHDRDRPLRVIGPPGLFDLFKALRRVFGRLGYEVELIEVEPGEPVRHDEYEVRPFAVEHGITAYGYALVEEERPGHLDPKAAERLGIVPGPDLGRLQRGEEVVGESGTVRPEDVMGPARAGRKIVISGDAAPSEMTRVAAHQAQLLVHDASFASDEAERAADTGHSTARDAGRLAADAEVRMLALVHVSSRYDVRAVLGEAREEFAGAFAPRDFDLVEIPFPERGVPRLRENGAREGGAGSSTDTEAASGSGMQPARG